MLFSAGVPAASASTSGRAFAGSASQYQRSASIRSASWGPECVSASAATTGSRSSAASPRSPIASERVARMTRAESDSIFPSYFLMNSDSWRWPSRDWAARAMSASLPFPSRAPGGSPRSARRARCGEASPRVGIRPATRGPLRRVVLPNRGEREDERRRHPHAGAWCCDGVGVGDRCHGSRVARTGKTIVGEPCWPVDFRGLDRARDQGENIQVVPLETGWRFAADPTNGGLEKGFAKPDFDDSGWKPIAVDRPWEAQGFEGLDGFAWYRIRFDLAKPPRGGAARARGDRRRGRGLRERRKVGGLGRFPRGRDGVDPPARLRRAARAAARGGERDRGARVRRGGRRRAPRRAPPPIVGIGVSWLSAARTREPSGFPAANFGLAMELAPDGEFPARIWTESHNSGAWLERWRWAGSRSARERRGGRARVARGGRVAPLALRARALRIPKNPKVGIRARGVLPAGARRQALLGGDARRLRHGPRRSTWGIARATWKSCGDSRSRGTRNVVAEERDGVAYGGFDGDALSMRCDAKTGRIDGDAVKTWSCKLSVAAGSSAEAHFVSPARRAAPPALDSAAWPDSSSLAFESLRRFAAARRRHRGDRSLASRHGRRGARRRPPDLLGGGGPAHEGVHRRKCGDHGLRRDDPARRILGELPPHGPLPRSRAADGRGDRPGAGSQWQDSYGDPPDDRPPGRPRHQ